MINNKYYPIIGIFLIVLIAVLIKFQENKNINEILKEDRKVIGKVYRFQSSNYNYVLHYEYIVNDVKYESWVLTSSFKCKNGVKGCLGSEFAVYYSAKDISKSVIDLGEYNKYKN
jgi:hypothetical protein